MNKKLHILATIKDGVALALINYLSLVLATVLYIVTIWIPYINVGTTIAMCSLPAEMAKGNVINPLFIFDGKYRRNMGEFFILYALMTGAIFAGVCFMIIPGIVISIAWSYAVVLFVDKDMSAIDSLRESNRITYGNKWRIFAAQFLVFFCLQIVSAIIHGLLKMGDASWFDVVSMVSMVALVIFTVPAMIGVDASIYKQLTTGNFIGEEPEEAPQPADEQAPNA